MSIDKKVLEFLVNKVNNDRTPSSPKTNEELAVEMKNQTGKDKDVEFLAGIIDKVKHEIQDNPNIDIPTAIKILFLTQTQIHPKFVPRTFPYGRIIKENGTIRQYKPNSKEEPELEREQVTEDRLEEMRESPDSNPLPWNTEEVQTLINELRYPGKSDMSLKDICESWSRKNSQKRTPKQYRDKAIQYLSYDFNQIKNLTLDSKASLLYNLKIPVHKTVLNCFYEKATFQLNENRELIYYESSEDTEFGQLDPAFPHLIIHRNTLFEDFYNKRKLDESIEQLADRFIYRLDYTGKKEDVIARFESIKKCSSTSPHQSENGELMQPTEIPSTSQDAQEVPPTDSSMHNVSDVKDPNTSSDQTNVSQAVAASSTSSDQNLTTSGASEIIQKEKSASSDDSVGKQSSPQGSTLHQSPVKSVPTDLHAAPSTSEAFIVSPQPNASSIKSVSTEREEIEKANDKPPGTSTAANDPSRKRQSSIGYSTIETDVASSSGDTVFKSRKIDSDKQAPSSSKSGKAENSKQDTEESSDPKPNDLNRLEPEQPSSSVQVSLDFFRKYQTKPESNVLELDVQRIIMESLRAIQVFNTKCLKKVEKFCEDTLKRKDISKMKVISTQFKFGLRFCFRMVRKYSHANQDSPLFIRSGVVLNEFMIIGRNVCFTTIEQEEMANQRLQMEEIQRICNQAELKMPIKMLKKVLWAFVTIMCTDRSTSQTDLMKLRLKVASGSPIAELNNSETVDTLKILKVIENGIDTLSMDVPKKFSNTLEEGIKNAGLKKTNCLDVVESVEECLCLTLNASSIRDLSNPVETTKILSILSNILSRLTLNSDELKNKVTKLIECSDKAMEICLKMNVPVKVTTNILEILVYNPTNAEEDIPRTNPNNP